MGEEMEMEMEAAEALAGLAHGVPGMMKVVEEDSVQVELQSSLVVDSAPIRQDLVRVEKEAKRLRRVLTNRESARRTIRRRQALCEDLMSKTAELMEENQRLKKMKELALQENESLETMNKNLKAQIVLTELKPVIGNSRSVHSSAYGNSHQGTYDEPQLSLSITAPSLCWRDLLHEQEELLNMAGPGPPAYMIPYPWFVPSCSEMRNVNESSAYNWTIPRSSLGSGDLVEVPIESPSLGNSSSSSQSDMILKFAKFLKPSSEEADHGNGFGLDLNCGGFNSVPVRSSNQENIPQIAFLGKKLGNMAAATTEARQRRRREIIRLKSVNHHRC